MARLCAGKTVWRRLHSQNAGKRRPSLQGAQQAAAQLDTASTHCCYTHITAACPADAWPWVGCAAGARSTQSWCMRRLCLLYSSTTRSGPDASSGVLSGRTRRNLPAHTLTAQQGTSIILVEGTSLHHCRAKKKLVLRQGCTAAKCLEKRTFLSVPQSAL